MRIQIRNQEKCLIPGMLILISGGMNIIESFMFYEYDRMADKCGWYVGCIIGTWLGVCICYRISVRISFITASIFITLGGLISAIDSDTSYVTASQWLDGIGCGITFLILIITGSEISSQYQRGRILSIESVGIGTGILVYSLIRAIHDSTESSGKHLTFAMTQVQGVISILLGIAAIAATYFCYDTPVSFLLRNNESGALYSIQHFQNELAISPFTYNMLEEWRTYIIDAGSRSLIENLLQGGVPFAKLCVARTVMSLTMTFPIVVAYYYAGTYGFKISWCLIFFGLSRWIGNIVGYLTLVDVFGRKKTLAICSLVAGALFIVVGAISNTLDNIGASRLITVGILILLGNLFCGLCQNISTVYLSEAFSLSVKMLFIPGVIFFENLAVIIIFRCFAMTYLHHQIAIYFLVVGALLLVISMMAVVVMPETKKLTLKQARHEFCDLINLKF